MRRRRRVTRARTPVILPFLSPFLFFLFFSLFFFYLLITIPLISRLSRDGCSTTARASLLHACVNRRELPLLGVSPSGRRTRGSLPPALLSWRAARTCECDVRRLACPIGLLPARLPRAPLTGCSRRRRSSAVSLVPECAARSLSVPLVRLTVPAPASRVPSASRFFFFFLSLTLTLFFSLRRPSRPRFRFPFASFSLGPPGKIDFARARSSASGAAPRVRLPDSVQREGLIIIDSNVHSVLSLGATFAADRPKRRREHAHSKSN